MLEFTCKRECELREYGWLSECDWLSLFGPSKTAF